MELEQVLFNLMRNALDAVAEVAGARKIAVEASLDGETAVIDVSDTGPGIRPDVRDRLFMLAVVRRAEPRTNQVAVDFHQLKNNRVFPLVVGGTRMVVDARL